MINSKLNRSALQFGSMILLKAENSPTAACSPYLTSTQSARQPLGLVGGEHGVTHSERHTFRILSGDGELTPELLLGSRKQFGDVSYGQTVRLMHVESRSLVVESRERSSVDKTKNKVLLIPIKELAAKRSAAMSAAASAVASSLSHAAGAAGGAAAGSSGVASPTSSAGAGTGAAAGSGAARTGSGAAGGASGGGARPAAEAEAPQQDLLLLQGSDGESLVSDKWKLLPRWSRVRQEGQRCCVSDLVSFSSGNSGLSLHISSGGTDSIFELNSGPSASGFQIELYSSWSAEVTSAQQQQLTLHTGDYLSLVHLQESALISNVGADRVVTDPLSNSGGEMGGLRATSVFLVEAAPDPFCGGPVSCGSQFCYRLKSLLSGKYLAVKLVEESGGGGGDAHSDDGGSGDLGDDLRTNSGSNASVSNFTGDSGGFSSGSMVLQSSSSAGNMGPTSVVDPRLRCCLIADGTTPESLVSFHVASDDSSPHLRNGSRIFLEFPAAAPFFQSPAASGAPAGANPLLAAPGDSVWLSVADLLSKRRGELVSLAGEMGLPLKDERLRSMHAVGLVLNDAPNHRDGIEVTKLSNLEELTHVIALFQPVRRLQRSIPPYYAAQDDAAPIPSFPSASFVDQVRDAVTQLIFLCTESPERDPLLREGSPIVRQQVHIVDLGVFGVALDIVERLVPWLGILEKPKKKMKKDGGEEKRGKHSIDDDNSNNPLSSIALHVQLSSYLVSSLIELCQLLVRLMRQALFKNKSAQSALLLYLPRLYSLMPAMNLGVKDVLVEALRDNVELVTAATTQHSDKNMLAQIENDGHKSSSATNEYYFLDKIISMAKKQGARGAGAALRLLTAVTRCGSDGVLSAQKTACAALFGDLMKDPEQQQQQQQQVQQQQQQQQNQVHLPRSSPPRATSPKPRPPSAPRPTAAQDVVPAARRHQAEVLLSSSNSNSEKNNNDGDDDNNQDNANDDEDNGEDEDDDDDKQSGQLKRQEEHQKQSSSRMRSGSLHASRASLPSSGGLPAAAAAAPPVVAPDWFYRIWYVKPPKGSPFCGVYIDSPMPPQAAKAAAMEQQPQPSSGIRFEYFMAAGSLDQPRDDQKGGGGSFSTGVAATATATVAASSSSSAASGESAPKVRLIRAYLNDNKCLTGFVRQLEALAAIAYDHKSSEAIIFYTPIEALLALIRDNNSNSSGSSSNNGNNSNSSFGNSTAAAAAGVGAKGSAPPLPTKINGRIRGHVHRLLRVLLVELASGRDPVIKRMGDQAGWDIAWVLDSEELKRLARSRRSSLAAGAKKSAAASAASVSARSIGSAISAALGFFGGKFGDDGAGGGGGGDVTDEEEEKEVDELEQQERLLALGPTRPLKANIDSDLTSNKKNSNSKNSANEFQFPTENNGTAAVVVDMTPQEPFSSGARADGENQQQQQQQQRLKKKSKSFGPMLTSTATPYTDFPADSHIRIYVNSIFEYLASRSHIVVDDSDENFAVTKAVMSLDSLLQHGYIPPSAFGHIVELLSPLLDGTRDTLSSTAQSHLALTWNRYCFDERNFYVVRCKVEITKVLHLMATILEYETAIECMRDFETRHIYGAHADGNDDGEAAAAPPRDEFILPLFSPMLPLGCNNSFGPSKNAVAAELLHSSSFELYRTRKAVLQREMQALREQRDGSTNLLLGIITENLTLVSGPGDEDNSLGGTVTVAVGDNKSGASTGTKSKNRNAASSDSTSHTLMLSPETRATYASLQRLLAILVDTARYEFDPLVESAASLFLRLTDSNSRIVPLLRGARFVPSTHVDFYRRVMDAGNVIDAVVTSFTKSQLQLCTSVLHNLLADIYCAEKKSSGNSSSDTNNNNQQQAIANKTGEVDASAVAILVNLSFHVRVAKVLTSLVTSLGGGIIISVSAQKTNEDDDLSRSFGSSDNSNSNGHSNKKHSGKRSKKAQKAEVLLTEFVEIANEFLLVLINASARSDVMQATLAPFIHTFVKTAMLCPRSVGFLLEAILRGNDLCLSVTDSTIHDLATAISSARSVHLARALRMLVYQEKQVVKGDTSRTSVFNEAGVFVANQAAVLDVLLSPSLRVLLRDLLCDGERLHRMVHEEGDILQDNSQIFMRRELMLALYHAVYKRSEVKAAVRAALFGDGNGFEPMLLALETTAEHCPVLCTNLLRMFNEVVLDDNQLAALSETEAFGRALRIVSDLFCSGVEAILADGGADGDDVMRGKDTIPVTIRYRVAEVEAAADRFDENGAPKKAPSVVATPTTASAAAAAAAASSSAADDGDDKRLKKKVGFQHGGAAGAAGNDDAAAVSHKFSRSSATAAAALLHSSAYSIAQATAAVARQRARLCYDNRDMIFFRTFIVILPIIRTLFRNFFDNRGICKINNKEAVRICRTQLIPAFARLADAAAHRNANSAAAIMQLAEVRRREQLREKAAAAAAAAVADGREDEEGAPQQLTEEELDRLAPITPVKWKPLAPSLNTPSEIFFAVDYRGKITSSSITAAEQVSLSMLPTSILALIADCILAARSHFIPLPVTHSRNGNDASAAAAAAAAAAMAGNSPTLPNSGSASASDLVDVLSVISAGSKAAVEEAIVLQGAADSHSQSSGSGQNVATSGTAAAAVLAATSEGGGGAGGGQQRVAESEDLIYAKFQAAVEQLEQFSTASPVGTGGFRISAAALFMLKGHRDLDATAALSNIARRVLKDSGGSGTGTGSRFQLNTSNPRKAANPTAQLKADLFELFTRLLQVMPREASLSDAVLLTTMNQTPAKKASSLFGGWKKKRDAAAAAANSSTSAAEFDADEPQDDNSNGNGESGGQLDEVEMSMRGTMSRRAAAAAAAAEADGQRQDDVKDDDDSKERQKQRLSLDKSLHERQNIVALWKDASLPPKTVAQLRSADALLILRSLQCANVCLAEGSRLAQLACHEYFLSSTTESFFEQARELLGQTRAIVLERSAILARIVRYAGNTKKSSSTGIAASSRRNLLARASSTRFETFFQISTALLGTIQEMAEGHNLAMQNLMRAQEDNVGSSLNLIAPILELTEALLTGGVDDDNAGVLRQALRTLTELCQGPCFKNCQWLIINNAGGVVQRIFRRAAHSLCGPKLLREMKREALILFQALLEPLNGRQRDHFQLASAFSASIHYAPLVSEMEEAHRAWRETEAGSSVTRKLSKMAPECLRPLGPYLKPAFVFFNDIINLLLFKQPKQHGATEDGDDLIDIVCRVAALLMTLLDIAEVACASQHTDDARSEGSGTAAAAAAAAASFTSMGVAAALSAAAALIPDSVGDKLVTLLRKSTAFRKVMHQQLMSVEIVREGKVERIYFQRPARMALLSRQTRKTLMDNVPLWNGEEASNASRLEDFIWRVTRIQQEMHYFERLSKDRLLSLVAKYSSQLEHISTAVSFVINFILLFGANVDNIGSDDVSLLSDTVRAHYNRLGELLIVVQILILLVFLFGELASEISARWAELTQQMNMHSGTDRITSQRAIIEDARKTMSLPMRVGYQIYFAATFPRTYRYVFFFVLSCIAFSGTPAAYSVQPLSIVYLIPTLGVILKAVSASARNLIVLFVFALTVLFLFATIAFFNFSEAFNSDIVGRATCDTLFSCYSKAFLVRSLAYGGGVIETAAEPYYGQNHWHTRLIFDFLFFAVVIIICLNLVFSVLLDSFSKNREILEEREEAKRQFCYICCLSKTELDTLVPGGFLSHCKTHHNYVNYIAFFVYLSLKEESEFTGPEQWVWNALREKSAIFFPMGTCYEKQPAGEEAAAMASSSYVSSYSSSSASASTAAAHSSSPAGSNNHSNTATANNPNVENNNNNMAASMRPGTSSNQQQQQQFAGMHRERTASSMRSADFVPAGDLRHAAAAASAAVASTAEVRDMASRIDKLEAQLSKMTEILLRMEQKQQQPQPQQQQQK